MAMWRRTCSKHYIIGIVTSLLIWIVATLAPGARKSCAVLVKEGSHSHFRLWIVTVDSVLTDRELMAFAIGAVTPQSVLKYVYYSFDPYIVHFGILVAHTLKDHGSMHLSILTQQPPSRGLKWNSVSSIPLA